MKIKFKITYYILAVITFLTIIVLPYNYLVANQTRQVTKKKFTESGAKEIAIYLTGIYSNFILETTQNYLDKYRCMDDKALSKLFDICHASILSATNEFGWNDAKIIFLSTDTNYVMDPVNLPSQNSEIEQRIIRKLRQGDKMALETKNGNFIIGVSFFDHTKTNKILLNGCTKCHERLLKKKERFRNDDHFKVKGEYVNGAIIFEIPSKI